MTTTTASESATSSTGDLRVAVVGAGMMGADHIRRITQKISNAAVTVIVEPFAERAAAAAALAPGSVTVATIEEAIDRDLIDAVVIATPGPYHMPVLLPALEAKLAVLCEKPLTEDPDQAVQILEAEQKLDRPYIQVGFMRRFDDEYMQLQQLIRGGSLGALLGTHHRHRNASVPDTYTNTMLISDSVVHEIDILNFLTGEKIVGIEVKNLKRNSTNATGFNDPILALLYTESGILADVEMNVNVGFGYQVTTEAVFEQGIANIGATRGIVQRFDGQISQAETPSFKERFSAAYDAEFQAWVDAARDGSIGGPSAWEGYLATVAASAGVRAISNGTQEPVEYIRKPDFYS
ncbi:gfo/Idh/MocA family oxidoreductase [Clavibacter michiganensis subsp. insidiosus]|uniref:Gfo/Idh/MocA family oxidoreductase n=1 Tax=Clavibacter michiganensis subsp. insidiosus TaxID=33014 RepID=A0A399SM47_9MICO|nr:gfo/Idh/MocA family oxidoreductase [Clavibacter michiganensis subsp. insidiosus]